MQGQEVSLRVLDNPNLNELSIDANKNIALNLSNYQSTLAFAYEVCLLECPNICNTGQASINISGANFYPSGFTPNGDGFNNVLAFPQLITNSANDWPNNELIVFNRWGSIVYQAKPYLNDWDGRNPKNGKPLPAGTYFYIIRLDIGAGEIKQRELTILR